jgi:hypothetical protein
MRHLQPHVEVATVHQSVSGYLSEHNSVSVQGISLYRAPLSLGSRRNRAGSIVKMTELPQFVWDSVVLVPCLGLFNDTHSIPSGPAMAKAARATAT